MTIGGAILGFFLIAAVVSETSHDHNHTRHHDHAEFDHPYHEHLTAEDVLKRSVAKGAARAVTKGIMRGLFGGK